jgi:hypothetical protein
MFFAGVTIFSAHSKTSKLTSNTDAFFETKSLGLKTVTPHLIKKIILFT